MRTHRGTQDGEVPGLIYDRREPMRTHYGTQDGGVPGLIYDRRGPMRTHCGTQDGEVPGLRYDWRGPTRTHWNMPALVWEDLDDDGDPLMEDVAAKGENAWIKEHRQSGFMIGMKPAKLKLAPQRWDRVYSMKRGRPVRACRSSAPTRTAENDDVQTEPVEGAIATERDRHPQGVEEVPAQQCRSSVDPRAAPKQTRKDDGEDGSPDGDKVLPLKQSDIDQTPVIALPQGEKREA